MSVLLLDGEDVSANATMSDLVPAVEQVFASYAEGTVKMPPKSYIDLPEFNGDFRAMPAYVDTGEWDAAGIKWVNVHPENPDEHDLPTVMGTLIYTDPASGRAIAIMDGTKLTMKRTGAAAAVATKHLAIEGARTLGIIGAGIQSYAQVEAIATVRPIQDVVVSDPDDEQAAAFVDHFSERFDVSRGSIQDATSCDVVSTVTPVREPIIDREDLGENTHVNAIGADAEGKQELTAEVLFDSKLVIDDYAQTTHSGEINVPFRTGDLEDEDIYGELGDVVTGHVGGRTDTDGVTLFDSTGLAIQDIAAARITYESARASDSGDEFRLLPSE